jgi:ABC-type multidrug transport system ATPase subunit
LLVRTNLWEARKRSVASFSGGMKQRFGIAQALLGNPKLLIVDEPTAGLDPAERRRFQNLLAEVSQGVVVILSTHIVDDVTDLCPRMAMIARGQVLVSGRPQDAIDLLRSRVWRRRVDDAQLDEYQRRFAVLSTRLVGGKPQINVYAETQPEEGFTQVEPGLEDVYFLQLRAMQPNATLAA